MFMKRVQLSITTRNEELQQESLLIRSAALAAGGRVGGGGSGEDGNDDSAASEDSRSLVFPSSSSSEGETTFPATAETRDPLVDRSRSAGKQESTKRMISLLTVCFSSLQNTTLVSVQKIAKKRKKKRRDSESPARARASVQMKKKKKKKKFSVDNQQDSIAKSRCATSPL
jgi:hypothetical protein